MADRLTIALRLKAARYLAGHKSDQGHAVPLPPADLAKLPAMAANGIKKNRIEVIEAMHEDARPFELTAVVDALGLPADWFRDDSALERLLGGDPRLPLPQRDTGSDADDPEHREGGR